MTDDLERNLKRWMQDRGAVDSDSIRNVGERISDLPARHPWRPSALAAAGLILALGMAALVVGPRLGVGTNQPSVPVPPDPAAFAGDPRLDLCGATVSSALAVFEMDHARDYRLHLPAMGLSPELDVDDPAFVLVYRAPFPFAGGAPAPQSGASQVADSTPVPTMAPGHHDVCVVVGTAPSIADRIIYADVDTAGLTMIVSSVAPTPSSSTPSAESTRSSSTAGPPTIVPRPAWAADLAGQLDCIGPPANIGAEVDQPLSPEILGSTAEEALQVFLGPSNLYASLPTEGFGPSQVDEHWASFGYDVDGRLKAVVVLTDQTDMEPGWTVVGLRACDASEFDPATPLTFPVTVWTDAHGQRVSTEVIRSTPGPGHCGWESTIWLHFAPDHALFFRDPNRVMREWTTTRFVLDAALPAEARDTGYRSGLGKLWIKDGGDAWLVLPGRVEHWPRSIDAQIGCM